MNIRFRVLPNYVSVGRIVVGKVAVVVVAPPTTTYVQVDTRTVHHIVQGCGARYIAGGTRRAPKWDGHVVHVQRVGDVNTVSRHVAKSCSLTRLSYTVMNSLLLSARVSLSLSLVVQ